MQRPKLAPPHTARLLDVALHRPQDASRPLQKRLTGGIGRQLLRHAIRKARRLGAASLFLGSSTTLPSAVRLYESVGFRHIQPESLPLLAYARADVFMQLAL